MTCSTAVGIDVSKKTLDVSIITSGEVRHKKFTNNISGIQSVDRFLKRNLIDDKVQVVLESTGDYHLLSSFKLGKEFNVRIINPIIARQHMKSTVRQVKNDKVDSLQLAELGLRQKLNTVNVTKREIAKRKLVSLIKLLEKHIASLKLSLKNMTRTLDQFGISMNMTESLKEKISKLEETLVEANEELCELVENKEIVKDLGQLKGITRITAAKIMALIEKKTFKSKNALVAFAGLDVSVRESGMWKGKVRLSKRGDEALRKYVVRIAWGLLMHNESFQKYAKVHKEKGRKFGELLVIIARKFLKMLYGAMKDGTRFNVDSLTTV